MSKKRVPKKKAPEPAPLSKVVKKEAAKKEAVLAEESVEIPEMNWQKPVRITLDMIAKSHLPPDSVKQDPEQILSALNKITHLRLDRKEISHIDNLELLGLNVTHVYLQMNRIETIENLDTLVNLRFMTLADNKIQTLQGLSGLKNLGFLELSNNNIQSVDIDELPKSLVILNLEENPCTKEQEHRIRLIKALPRLQQLDKVEVTRQEKLAAGYVVSDSEDEDEDEEDDEEEEDVDKELDQTKSTPEQTMEDIVSTMKDIRSRLKSRMEEQHEEHMGRMEELAELKEKYTTESPPQTPTVAASEDVVEKGTL